MNGFKPVYRIQINLTNNPPIDLRKILAFVTYIILDRVSYLFILHSVIQFIFNLLCHLPPALVPLPTSCQQNDTEHRLVKATSATYDSMN
jgi:hypothetical protein